MGVPFTQGNAIERLRNGDQIFAAMFEAIGGATRSIDFLTFGYWNGEIGRRMAEALDGLRGAFGDTWIETERNYLDPSGDMFPAQPPAGDTTIQVIRGASESSWSDISTLYLTCLQIAHERLWVTTAYFVPDAEMT